MNSRIPETQKHGTKHRQADGIALERQDVEAEGGQDGGARDFDVQAVLVVDEGLVAGLVDDEAFEGEVEDGELEGGKSQRVMVICVFLPRR